MAELHFISEVIGAQKRFTGACHNGEPVGVRGTLRCERLGSCELVASPGEGSLNYEGRFTIYQ